MAYVVALTERELAVLNRLPSLLTIPEIASALYVSTNTVKTHLRNAYRKLGVASRREAVQLAEQLGLLAHPIAPPGQRAAPVRPPPPVPDPVPQWSDPTARRFDGPPLPSPVPGAIERLAEWFESLDVACARALANAERLVWRSRQLQHQAALLRHRAQLHRMRAERERHDHSRNRLPVVTSYARPAARARVEE